MAEEQSWVGRMVESWKEAQAERLQEFMGQGMAMLREGVEDSRSAIMGEWAGGPSAMGTPLNPTAQMVTESIQGSYEDQLAAVHGQPVSDPGVGVQAPAAMEAGESYSPEAYQPEAYQPPPTEVKPPEMEM